MTVEFVVVVDANVAGGGLGDGIVFNSVCQERQQTAA